MTREGYGDVNKTNNVFWAKSLTLIQSDKRKTLIRKYIFMGITMRFTPQLGRRSVAADTKSFPYFFSKTSLIATSSGISEHLGAAKIKLAMPSFRSAGHSL